MFESLGKGTHTEGMINRQITWYTILYAKVDKLIKKPPFGAHGNKDDCSTNMKKLASN